MTEINLKTPIKAAILVQQNEPLIVDKIELPKVLEVGQVLVKVHTSGICGSQLGEISGVKGKDKFLPHLMGHEGCATILEIGPGVKYLKKDDKVVLHWRKGQGIEAAPPKYLWKGDFVNAGWVTTFNTHAIVSENRCTSIPKDTNEDLAALFGCAITTGFGVIENNANLKMGQSIVIFGAGGVGLNMIQAASMHSAWPIIAVDLHQTRLDIAKLYGATHTINSSENDAFKSINSIVSEEGVDIFIDNTGQPTIIESGYQLINKNGKVILVGVPNQNSNINIHSLGLHFGKVITGSHGGESIPDKDIPRYLKLFREFKLGTENLVTSRFKLDEINIAIESMRKGKVSGRVMIDL